MKINKEQWLKKTVFADEYGRPYNLSDVPMTYITRKEAYNRMKLKEKDIDKLWKEYKQYKTEE